jgi:hypothetical protein
MSDTPRTDIMIEIVSRIDEITEAAREAVECQNTTKR